MSGKKNEQFSELLYLCTQNEKTDVIYGGSAAYDYTGADRQHQKQDTAGGGGEC